MLVVKASLRGGAGAGEDVGGAFVTAVDEGRLEAGRLGLKKIRDPLEQVQR